MRTHNDPSHVPKRQPAILTGKNERGEWEARVNNAQRELLGTFPTKPMLDLFVEMLVGLCGPNGCACGDLEAHLAAA